LRRMRQTLDWDICNSRLARVVDFWGLLTNVPRTRSTVSADGPGRPYHVPFTNCSVCRWFCVVHDPKLPLRRHNWLSFGKFQYKERFLIHYERHFSSRLPPSGVTCKYAKAPSTKKTLERFSTYWYAPFCRVCLGCCAVEFGKSRRDLWITLYIRITPDINSSIN